MNKVKIVKGIVLILTFVMIFVFILLINSLVKNIRKANVKMEENISINQPVGSNIKNVLTNRDYLYIVVGGGNIPDRIVVISTSNGKIVSNISLN